MSEDAGLSRGGLGDAPSGAGAVESVGHGEVVNTPRECVGCGYELKGQPIAGVCPECGDAVARTLAVELLRDDPRSMLKRVRAGLLLYAIGPVVAMGVWILAVALVQIRVFRSSASADEALMIFTMVISFAGVAMTLLGGFALSIAGVVGSKLRTVVRVGAACLVLALATIVVFENLPAPRSQTVQDIAVWVMIGGASLVALGVSRCGPRIMVRCNSHSGERIARRGVVGANVFVCLLLGLALFSLAIYKGLSEYFWSSSKYGATWFYTFQLVNGLTVLNVLAWVVLNAVVHIRLARRVDRERAIAAALSPERSSDRGA